MGNTFLYKDGEAKLFEESDVESLMADGWHDNPADGAKQTKEAAEPGQEEAPKKKAPKKKES